MELLYIVSFAKNTPTEGSNLRVWQSAHFGGHRFAPTLIDLPIGHLWGHLDEEKLRFRDLS